MGGLTNQIYLYSLETKDFYTEEEEFLNEKYFKSLRIKKKIKKIIEKNTKNLKNSDNFDEKYIEKLKNHNEILKNRMNYVSKISTHYKKLLNSEIANYPTNVPRKLKSSALKINNKVGLFESALTRTCKFKTNQTTEELFIIRVFHYEILESIIHNGFEFNGEKYIYLTSSAGQIRTKKIVCIKESLYKKHENTITCGLTLEIINEKGGVNTNKYQAYLALANSASDIWKRFNIDRMIVVPDMETLVHSEVDYINRDTFEITRQEMDIPIEHMDGCGIMLPSVSKSSFMFRMPWMKGLLTPFDFIKFIEETGASSKVTDIYGKEYDLIEDNINIILTKSQFKMWKFYESWDEYKSNFKKYKCEASKLNVENIGTKATINYQMLQTLTSMTTEELETVATETVNDIISIGEDKEVMMKALGAVKENKNPNYFQKALMLYPELLSDSYSREVIKSKKKSMVRDGRAGKILVNGYYTFIIPDVYAFCEWLLLGEKDPKGLLTKEQVYCNIHNEGEVDILRAPHLYKEHAIRTNTLDENIGKWFITKGIYTSVHDPISKILMFDVDGDKSLVVQDDTIINVAKRDMEGVVPLYYEMTKAKDEPLTPDKIFLALTSAYKANIGIISNEITKIWNSDKPNVDAVKWLCLLNNFTIDFAKTLFMPEKPEFVEEELKKFSKLKLPHFFKYAKDKEDGQIDLLNNSTVNKLYNIIPNKPIQFKKVVGNCDHKLMMGNRYPTHDKEKNEKLIEKFVEINRKKHIFFNEENKGESFYLHVKEEMMKIYKNESYIADVLCEYFFSKDSSYKETLWKCYGEFYYKNLEESLKGTCYCENCKSRFSSSQSQRKLCDECKEFVKKQKTRERVKKYRKK